jgi:CheY-specific phosphatase CheX
MNTTMITITEWLEYYVEAVNDVAKNALGFDECNLIKTEKEQRTGLVGSYLALVSDEICLQIGVASGKDDCRELARALLGMSPDDGDISDEEVADAVGEIVNILAGVLKGKVNDRANGIKLGLPIFIDGRIKASDQQQTLIGRVKLGSIPVELLILMHR